MSYIDAISQANTASSANSVGSTNSSSNYLGKEDFLTLLVAQLQNQDPLNPEDPSAFTAQLAQFSSLEQLFNLNDSMNNLVTSNANSDKFSTLQTIGKYVVYQDSDFEFDGEESVQLGYMLDGDASEVQITIQRNGETIAVLEGEELTKGNHFLTWDGSTESGTTADSGTYTITISAKAAEDGSIAASPLIKSIVTGVDLTGNYGGTLQTKTGEVAFTAILGVYENSEEDDTTAEEEEEETDESENRTVNTSIFRSRQSLREAATDEVASLADKYGIKDDGQISLNLQY